MEDIDPIHGGSTGGGRIVQVRGYTKANGTYVAGYKRSLPGSGSKSKSTTTTQKSSYLTDTYGDRSANRKKNFNATQVQAIPRSPGAVAGPDARFFSLRKTVRVRGYTRSNGTYVAGCTRSLPSPKRNSEKSSVATSNGSSGLVSSARCSSHQTNPIGSSNGKVVLVKGYTRSDGTHVASYTRSLPTKKSKIFAAVHHELVPIATTGGDAQIAKCTKLAIKTHPILNHGSTCNAKPISGVQPKREHIKKEKLAVSGLLDTTNTSHLPTSRVSEQQKVHSKDSFKLHNSPLATGAKREHCHPAQTAVQGS